MSKHAAPATDKPEALRLPLKSSAPDPGFSSTAFLIAATAATLAILISTTFRVSDVDFWQHLVVGKVIWKLRSVPQSNIWTWPTFGEPYVLPSWGFRALLWPFWRLGGMAGLMVWRWATTLGAFSILWATSRRMGARGMSSFVVIVLCSLVYRLRSNVRPETLVAILLALQLWILETRRHGGPDRCLWLVPLALIWANVHISYYLGFVFIAIHLLDGHVGAWSRSAVGSTLEGATRLRRLWLVALASAAVSFANPFGWRALWQPFEYFIVWRHEPIYRTIAELLPLDWGFYRWDGLLALMLAWPVLQLWRARRSSTDLVEALSWFFATALALANQRFVGIWALLAAVYLSRDLDELVHARRWAVWIRPAWTRASLIVAACAILPLADWMREDLPIGYGVEGNTYPAGACDFIARHDIRGRSFNHFECGGYMLWRFWPERDRLPFMDIHQTGTTRDRLLYAYSMTHREGWEELDRRYRFDFVILRRLHAKGDALLDFLDADSVFSLVFVDDAAALYLRRSGRCSAVADSFAYNLLPGGKAQLDPLARRCAGSHAFRAAFASELERAAASSQLNSAAFSLLANLSAMDGNFADARRNLSRAHATDPLVPRYHERMGLLLLAEGDARSAVAELKQEWRVGESSGLATEVGRAYLRLADAAGARWWFQRALALDPGNGEALDSLRALGVERVH